MGATLAAASSGDSRARVPGEMCASVAGVTPLCVAATSEVSAVGGVSNAPVGVLIAVVGVCGSSACEGRIGVELAGGVDGTMGDASGIGGVIGGGWSTGESVGGCSGDLGAVAMAATGMGDTSDNSSKASSTAMEGVLVAAVAEERVVSIGVETATGTAIAGSALVCECSLVALGDATVVCASNVGSTIGPAEMASFAASDLSSGCTSAVTNKVELDIAFGASASFAAICCNSKTDLGSGAGTSSDFEAEMSVAGTTRSSVKAPSTFTGERGVGIDCDTGSNCTSCPRVGVSARISLQTSSMESLRPRTEARLFRPEMRLPTELAVLDFREGTSAIVSLLSTDFFSHSLETSAFEWASDAVGECDRAAVAAAPAAVSIFIAEAEEPLSNTGVVTSDAGRRFAETAAVSRGCVPGALLARSESTGSVGRSGCAGAGMAGVGAAEVADTGAMAGGGEIEEDVDTGMFTFASGASDLGAFVKNSGCEPRVEAKTESIGLLTGASAVKLANCFLGFSGTTNDSRSDRSRNDGVNGMAWMSGIKEET